MIRLALLALLVACDPKEEAAATAPSDAPAALTTAPAVAASWRPTEEITGSLEPAASVQLGFAVGGRLEKLEVSRGDVVSAGQVLARLDTGLASAQLAQAEAAVAGAQAQLAAGEAAFARATALYEAKGLSDQQYADAKAGVEAGRAGLEQARAAARLARENLGYHSLRAPIGGVVTNGPDNVGMVIGPGNPLFVIEDLSALQLKGTASESASWLSAGLTATVLAGNGVTVPATVTRVIPSLDPATRRLPVELRIDAPGPEVRAHSFARATITAGSDQPAVAVPKGALVARPDFLVFRMSADKPEKVQVSRLGEQGDLAIIGGPIAVGDLVVVDPPAGLGDE